MTHVCNQNCRKSHHTYPTDVRELSMTDLMALCDVEPMRIPELARLELLCKRHVNNRDWLINLSVTSLMQLVHAAMSGHLKWNQPC